MKTNAFVLTILLGFSTQAGAIDINRYHSGTWVNYSQLGHGFNIQVLPGGITIVYWYVYHPDGTPTFLIGVGTNDGKITSGSVYYNTGMKFGEFNPADVTETEWGSFTLTFEACDSAIFEYVSVLQHEGVPYGAGTIPISKYIGIEGMPCSDNRYAGLYRGYLKSQSLWPIYLENMPMAFPGVAILAPDGFFKLLAENGWMAGGTWEVQDYSDVDKALVATGTAFSLNYDVFGSGGVFDLNGPIVAEQGTVGSYYHQFGDYGDHGLYATSALYQQEVTMGRLEREYGMLDEFGVQAGLLTISATGAMAGSFDNGCGLTGQVSIPNPGFNLLTLDLDLANCGDRSGPFTGYGFLDDLPHWGESFDLILLTDNGKDAFVLKLASQ
jgi:hypothetical protein